MLSVPNLSFIRFHLYYSTAIEGSIGINFTMFWTRPIISPQAFTFCLHINDFFFLSSKGKRSITINNFSEAPQCSMSQNEICIMVCEMFKEPVMNKAKITSPGYFSLQATSDVANDSGNITAWIKLSLTVLAKGLCFTFVYF